jgi:hypothetical protein
MFAIWHSKQVSQQRTGNLEALGERWHGRVIPATFLSQPRLEIRVDAIPGEVSFYTGSKNQRAWTKVHFDWKSRQRLRITPEGFTSWMRSVFGGTDVTVGDPGFDATYWIESSDERWAQEVLTPNVRRAMLGLRGGGSWFGSTVVTVDLGPAGLVLKVDRLLVDDPAALERFVEMAILVLTEARGAGESAGIVVAAVEIKAGSECPVCGHAVTSDKRECPQCRTPHHGDCWTYSGGCAIFGCAGRKAAA